jgi:amino acid adenylation domain-containing protein
VTDPWIVPRDIDESLRRLSLRTGTPLSAPWFAAWCTALMRISSVAEIVVADVADGREHEAVARAPGIFARHVPVRLAVNLDIPFEQMVRRTDQIRNVAREWGDHFSWETLPPRTQHNGLEAPAYLPFSFCYEEYQRRWRVRGGEFSIDARRQLFEGQHFALRVVRTENDLAVELQYDATRVSRADATRALGYLGNLVTAAAADPEARAASLRLLRADERRELLGDVATATTRLPAAGCFHEAFARLAAEKPDATAVACLEASLSYRELDRKASLLARALRERGIRPEARVGLLTERSTDVLVGVLGIWKAGGVYVPLDPTQPPERLEFILNDAGVGLVLTQRSMSDLLPASLARLGIDGTWSDDTRYPERSPVAATSSQNLAYVIYTSGSSGQPKGVMVSHASLLNLVSGLNDTIYRGRGVQRVSLNAPLTFDASIKQIATLALGMTVDIIPEEVRADPQRTLEYLASRSIDVLECTPFQFGRLLDAGWTSNGDARRPSVVLLGGESVEVSLLQAFLGDARTTLFNMYGPTECTVDVAVGRLASERDAAIVGRPLANVRAYILDGNLEPVPRGVVGELFVGGLGVARGYLGRPGLTAACFVPDPFGGHGGRLYRTGDAASYEADGRIRIRGRLDRQVKVRGVRVEPGEIEELLRRQPDIRDAAVLVERSNAADPRIVAYVVPKAGRAPAVVEGARTEARRALPTYMVPTDFVLLERLPLTANGKLDYAALPELAAASRRTDVPYVEPRSEIERKIAQIWREELQVAHFGIQDNFFDLGGHSLLMARVHARLCATFGREITLVEMFRYPTVGLLAKYFAGYERVEGHTVEEAVGRATRRRLRRGRAGERDV